MRPFKLPPYQRTRRQKSQLSPKSPTSTFTNSFQLQLAQSMAVPFEKLPNGCVVFAHQVAGHIFQPGTQDVGMLKNVDDGTVLKPGGTPKCAAREIKFYEELQSTTDPTALQLKEFIPEYRGTKELIVGDRNLTFLKLVDLTFEMQEPCIIDLKMGSRTWDPLASDAKRDAEEVF
jgi:1D-myo-inositol-tetrakisphosphate 5-kinase/inositol-polyphosphate multikinase